jgi:Protein of unknown function (DUF1592)/Protein of unknown function (DUF1588)/Protein of unknown function (DUF1585)/Protein of unknown function (DUF1595)/Protein of unknown function (DUF1587)
LRVVKKVLGGDPFDGLPALTYVFASSKARARVVSAATLTICSAALTGCTGQIEGPSGSASPSVAGAGGGAGSTSVPGAMPQTGVDPGRAGIHRLNNAEYDNTVRDLLGTSSQPAAMFLAEEGLNFDNTATALGMTTAQYEGYFNAARDLMVESLANAAESARFMSCTPAASADPCARQLITTFGMQIYRRPLETADIDRAMKVYDADIARAQTGTEAIGQALRAMLSAANFLYRIEYDQAPTSTTPHALSGYELASRLSYLTFSSMPDAALFDAAKNGQLATPGALEATLDRLLADPKASAFVESFAGQWLSTRKLLTHSVTAQVFPTYTPELSDAMIGEGNLWFQEFLNQDRPLSDWFTADFNYVNDVLAQHYGMPVPGTGAKLVRVEVTTDQRRGFLGLASFLTQTSVPSRTSPTSRGNWVLSQLLCSPPPPPPGNVPKLDDSAAPADASQPTGAENVRVRLEKHRQDPTCAGCHALLDPIGLGLERYDGIGRYRETYGNGDPIDPAGTLPDGTAFAGADQLGALVGKDPRFSACAASKLFTYALGREIEPLDAATVQKLNEGWAARGLTFKNLLKEIVVSDAFRFRRGEPE